MSMVVCSKGCQRLKQHLIASYHVLGLFGDPWDKLTDNFAVFFNQKVRRIIDKTNIDESVCDSQKS
jgi:hypothetical protein